MTATENLPLWSVADVHESLTSRSFVDALERVGADVGRLESLYDRVSGTVRDLRIWVDSKP